MKTTENVKDRRVVGLGTEFEAARARGHAAVRRPAVAKPFDQ
ncbi:hypothetical protein ACIBG8_08525 [Nonomuraea sp. NPDC050556]